MTVVPSRTSAMSARTTVLLRLLEQQTALCLALVEALQEFSSREVNLSRIESRPLRRGLGRYMFFCDLEGAEKDPPVGEAIKALRTKAESVRILGSYPVG